MPYKNKEKVEDELCGIVRKLESDYTSGNGVVLSKYVTVDMYEDINKIQAYLNSKHTSGETDALGREKPFFNIVVAASNIWYRATEIRQNKIKVRPSKSKDTIDSLLASIHLQDWMKRENYGLFLSQWGRTLARYGSAVVKYVEKEGKLIPSVIPWDRLIVDSVDFDKNIKIEVLELTESELYQRKGYDMTMVQKLCDAKSTRKTLDRTQVDTKSEYIRVYEVHGNLPLRYITGKNKDDDTYVDQMHVISFLASKEKGSYDDFTLYSGRENGCPLMITHLIPEDGMTLSTGSVKYLFDSQWMVNHGVKSTKDQLDLASKLIFQTSDPSFQGQNALAAIETGDILVHLPNQPITQVNNASHDITSQQSFGNQWKALGNELTGISESMLGNTAPSGTAWRQVEALLQQNQTLFEVMKENKKWYLINQLRTYVLPFLKKKMDTSKEVSATLEAYDIDNIDRKYIKNKSIEIVNKKMIKDVLASGDVPTPEQQTEMTQLVGQGIQQGLSEQGNQRFFIPSDVDDTTWKEQFKNLEWELDIDVKDEQVNNDAATTLTTLFKMLGGLQGRPLTPDEKMVMNKILSLTGTVSPLELASNSTQPLPPPQPSPVSPLAPQPVT